MADPLWPGLRFTYWERVPATKPTWDFLRRVIEDGFGAHIKDSQPTLVTVETAAALFFLLRKLPGERFPGGKWATIQHLEGLVEKTVVETLDRMASDNA